MLTKKGNPKSKNVYKLAMYFDFIANSIGVTKPVVDMSSKMMKELIKDSTNTLRIWLSF